MKPENLSYEDFVKLDIRVGMVVTAETVPKSKKLLQLQVNFGELGTRIILAGVAGGYQTDQLVGQYVVAVLNLAPRQMMGITSHGMLLAAHNKFGQPVLLTVSDAVLGSEVG